MSLGGAPGGAAGAGGAGASAPNGPAKICDEVICAEGSHGAAGGGGTTGSSGPLTVGIGSPVGPVAGGIAWSGGGATPMDIGL